MVVETMLLSEDCSPAVVWARERSVGGCVNLGELHAEESLCTRERWSGAE